MLAGKTIIVTGGAKGLGQGIVNVCHREGANVVIADLRGNEAAQFSQTLGERAYAVQCDVRNSEDLASLVDQTTRRFRQIDGLVNNAGVNFVKPFLDVASGEWDNVLGTDLRAGFLLTQLVCRHMLERSLSGSIVNISSVHSYAALPGAAPYDAAKWGVVGMTKSIAVELAARGIRVNCVSPGLINTLIWRDILDASPDRKACEEYWKSNIPIGRVIEPEEIGEIVCFLLSDRSQCITGSNIFADGGMTSQLVSRKPW